MSAGPSGRTCRVRSRVGSLNLRTGPGTKYQVIMRMYNGEEVEVLETKGKWVRVRHYSGSVGWAYRDYLVE